MTSAVVKVHIVSDLHLTKKHVCRPDNEAVRDNGDPRLPGELNV